MNNELKGILGLCRRAGKICLGHDASVASIKQRKAFLAITCADTSDRLKKEIADECNFDSRKTKFLVAEFTMQDLGFAIGKKAGVFTITDEGFANKLYSILTGGYEYGD